MKTSMQMCFVGWTLAVAVAIPLAGASGPEPTKDEADARAALKTERADEMTAWSVDSGGGESSGGDFALTAAIGQPDAGVVSQGDTVIAGGLWAGALGSECIFCDGFESGDTGAWSAVVGGIE